MNPARLSAHIAKQKLAEVIMPEVTLPVAVLNMFIEMKEDIATLKEDMKSCSATITDTREYQLTQNGAIRDMQKWIWRLSGIVVFVVFVLLPLYIGLHDHFVVGG